MKVMKQSTLVRFNIAQIKKTMGPEGLNPVIKQCVKNDHFGCGRWLALFDLKQAWLPESMFNGVVTFFESAYPDLAREVIGFPRIENIICEECEGNMLEGLLGREK